MTTKNGTGSTSVLGNAIASLDDRLRQLQSITPGVDGGGSVATPFKIGDKTFGPGAQVDTNKLADIARPGDRWEAEPFLPIISQGVTDDIAYTTRYSEVLVGDEVVWNFFFDITGAGTVGSALAVSLPRLAFRATDPTFLGQVQIYDANTGTRYSLEAETTAAGRLIQFGGSSTGGSVWGGTPSLAIAATDQIRGMLRYRPRNSG